MDVSLLLASKSPRRRQLLSQLGLPLEIVSIDVDEHIDSDIAVSQIAETLALRKANGFPRQNLCDNQILITADTIVALDGKMLGKPKDAVEASTMLHALSGRSHIVYSGVCITSSIRQVSFTEATTVTFRSLADSEIDYYISQYKPFDKAGAYGIQEWIGMIGVESISGCYYNVMGLPLSHLWQELQRWL